MKGKKKKGKYSEGKGIRGGKEKEKEIKGKETDGKGKREGGEKEGRGWARMDY